jgi:glycosyltransferase involved in cell wall biosynthesis
MGRALADSMSSFDLVHIHGIWSYCAFASWKAARRSGVPIVVSTHGMLDPFLLHRGKAQKFIALNGWIQPMLRDAAAIHCTAEPERQQISSFAPDTDRAVIPNGLHIDKLATSTEPGAFRHETGIENAAPIILNHGRLSYKKGLDILIRAFAIVRETVPDARLVLVGPDDEGIRTGLEALSNDLGLGKAVLFTGELTGARLANAISAADVWALTSHAENFGIAVVEAMAAGKPTVISNAVNIAQDAQDAGATVMVDVDADAAASAILRLLGDKELRRSIGDHALRFVERFDWTNVSGQYLSLYRGVLAS